MLSDDSRICLSADLRIRWFAHSPMRLSAYCRIKRLYSPLRRRGALLGKAQVGKAFSPSQCGRSHYPTRTTENSVKAETIRSLPFSGGSLRNISKALSTSQAPEFSCRWTPLTWAVSSYIGRLYLHVTAGSPCIASCRNELNQESLCFDKLNMTEDAVGWFANLPIRGFADLLICNYCLIACPPTGGFICLTV